MLSSAATSDSCTQDPSSCIYTDSFEAANCCGDFLPAYVMSGFAILTKVQRKTDSEKLLETLFSGYVLNWMLILVIGIVSVHCPTPLC